MKRILIILLTINCSLFTIHCSAKLHGQERIDSLRKELPRQKEDTGKVKVLNSLSATYYSLNTDSSLHYGLQGLKLSSTLGWKSGMSLANNLIGSNYLSLSNYAAALDYFSKSLKLSEEIGHKERIAGTIRNMVPIYLNQGEFARALELNKKALKVAEEMGNKKEIAHQVSSIANIYFSMSDFPRTLEAALRSLKICEEINDTIGIARVTLVIGNVYMARQEYPKARQYLLKALALFELAGSKDGIAAATGNIGVTYIQEKHVEDALQYFFRSLHLAEETGDLQSMAQITLSIGGAYAVAGDYINALAYETEALKLEEQLGAWPNVTYALGIIGKIYLSLAQDSIQKNTLTDPERTGRYKGKEIPKSKTEQLRLALNYLKRSRDSATRLGVLEVIQTSSKDLADAYRMTGQFDKALAAFEEYTTIKDSVFNKENEQKIVQQQLKYDYGKREDSLKLLTAEKEKVAAVRYQRQRSYTLAGIGGILLLAAFSFLMLRNNKLLAKEKQRSEILLLNILPAEVAEELKGSGSSKARHYDNVTVLFTDFVNFTQAGESMSPQGLIDELHACFKMFDEITSKYNIEKIKTIGDAYLAVCGLPSHDPKHAENVVRAAIEINAFMQDRLSKLGSDRTFHIRIGIHSGSVVAGIVGVKKFAYDIWGDTVNTAARMEQNSEAGKINISEKTYELVKDKIPCEYRGEVEAKGKGVMKMYFVS